MCVCVHIHISSVHIIVTDTWRWRDLFARLLLWLASATAGEPPGLGRMSFGFKNWRLKETKSWSLNIHLYIYIYIDIFTYKTNKVI